MRYVPRHLPNKLEYNCLCCIPKSYFSPLSVTDDKQRDRNHPFSSSYSAGRVMLLFKIIGDLVDVAAWGIVLCVSKHYTLRIEG